MPPFVTAHTFCAFRGGARNSGLLSTVPANTDVFLRGSNMSTREKKILSRAVGILKENWGIRAFSRDN